VMLEMPRKTGNQGAHKPQYSQVILCAYSAVHRTFNGSNVGYFSLSAADDCCAHRDDYCSGQGRTYR
jgi:hypothetical protein